MNRLVLSKCIEAFAKEFDFTEGIVSEIRWDTNLIDLLITVYYFWDEYKGKSLTIRIKNCREANFNMPKHYNTVPKSDLKNYIYSWYTITQFSVKASSGLVEIGIQTIDTSPRWLTALCEEVWIEDEIM